MLIPCNVFFFVAVLLVLKTIAFVRLSNVNGDPDVSFPVCNVLGTASTVKNIFEL